VAEGKLHIHAYQGEEDDNKGFNYTDISSGSRLHRWRMPKCLHFIATHCEIICLAPGI